MKKLHNIGISPHTSCASGEGKAANAKASKGKAVSNCTGAGT